MRWCINPYRWPGQLKGIVHRFWMNNIFIVPQREKHFSWKVHLDKTTLTQNNREKWCSRSVCVIYITVIGQTDFELPIFSVISSQSCFIEMELLQKCFFCWGTIKMLYIQNCMVNNSFKEWNAQIEIYWIREYIKHISVHICAFWVHLLYI